MACYEYASYQHSISCAHGGLLTRSIYFPKFLKGIHKFVLKHCKRHRQNLRPINDHQTSGAAWNFNVWQMTIVVLLYYTNSLTYNYWIQVLLLRLFMNFVFDSYIYDQDVFITFLPIEKSCMYKCVSTFHGNPIQSHIKETKVNQQLMQLQTWV